MSTIPSVLVLVFLTDEFSSVISGLSEELQLSFFLTFGSLIFVIIIAFSLSFLANLRYVRKKSYSLLAATHVLIQLLIVTTCFLILATARPTLINWSNWFGFILSGFFISFVISEITYGINYRNSFPTYLIPIEEVLSKNCTDERASKPSFFRQEGFLWTDFKEGVITERIETREIIKKLKTEKSVILIGDQASGKSNILRNVGYELANNGFIVFFINADSLDTNSALSEIKKWDMSNVVLIIDDVHRNISTTSDFLNRVHSNNIKVVLSSRPANFNILKEKAGQRLLCVLNKSVEVKTTESVIRDIVLKYVHSIDEKFNVSSNMIKEIIQKCGTDLWLLTYLLLAWNAKNCPQRFFQNRHP